MQVCELFAPNPPSPYQHAVGFERHALEREPVRRHFEAASWFLPSLGAFCCVDGPVSASPERVHCPRHPRHRQGARLTAQAGPAVGGAGSRAGPGHGPWQGSLSRGARGAVGPVTLASSKNCESRPAVGAGFRAPVKRPVEYGALPGRGGTRHSWGGTGGPEAPLSSAHSRGDQTCAG